MIRNQPRPSTILILERYPDTFRFRQDLQFIDSRGSVVRRRGRRSMETGGRDMILLFLTRNESKQHSKKKEEGKEEKNVL